ncbi:hypothetical protein [Catellatospora citrea]|uniref:Mannosyltransferase PIG-V n=1 Tax=Catellatospora citrea TaxID=53366 RepID=A0A8J3KX34_9ACTN|nr:hypothetical protein [Catellatospora citrea]RKE09636.1 hypothetical protein C8E86_4526 [Catellatospora citrea]GIG02805.1 hypothetical protein Cci01nite_78980 [Catellatospora citrea]
MSSAPFAVLAPEVPATAPEDPPSPSRWRRRASALLPPVLAYLVSHLVYTVAGALVAEPFLPVSGRVRADSGLYALVASRGYELFLCDADPDLGPMFAPGAWCGTAGWFPLYPGLIRVLTWPTGLGEYEAGLLVTEVCLLLSFVLLWRLLRNTARPGAVAVLALATLLPAGVYLHAVFPMALAGALLLACVTAVASRRWVLAGLAGALVAAAYPMGVAVAAIGFGAVLTLLGRRELRPWAAVRAALAVCGLPLAGLGAVFGVHQLTVGHWNAYLMIQEHYGNGLHNPLHSLAELATEPSVIPIAEPRQDLLWVLHVFTDAELWWSLALALLVVAAAVIASGRGRLRPFDAGLAIYAVALFVGPLIAGPGVSQYRSHTLLLPVLLVLRHLPAKLLWPYAAVAGVIAVPMGMLFSTWLLF